MARLEEAILKPSFYSAAQLQPYQLFEIVQKTGKEKYSRPVYLGTYYYTTYLLYIYVYYTAYVCTYIPAFSILSHSKMQNVLFSQYLRTLFQADPGKVSIVGCDTGG